jgi:hypothetical protein
MEGHHMADKILTQEYLRDYLVYDSHTGLMTRKKHAIGKYHEGYLYISINGSTYGAHRLAWIYEYGSIPEGLVIDHINGKRHDNKITNLRAVTQSENAKNRGIGHTPSRLQLMLRQKDMLEKIYKKA